ncbi:hypothetical protein B0H13DRAFT_2343384 [Mycena leptocephala]|nr:hypothetical protein B0H13DRAFT_2343384 [Mycena leptocephala]
MSPHDLTPAEIAKLMAPENHPTPLTADELEQLVSPLTDEQFGEVVDHLGLSDLARQLPPVLLKVMRVVQHLTRDRPPEYDDEIDTLIRNFEFMDLPEALDTLQTSPATPPPASPEPPQTPVKAHTTQSTLSTPRPGSTRHAGGYIVNSPTKSGHVVCWFKAGSLTQGVPNASAVQAGAGGSRGGSGRKSAAYVVFYGQEAGVFTLWADVIRNITGCLAIHASYSSVEAAHAALDYARARGWTSDSSPSEEASTWVTPPDDNALNFGRTTNFWYAVCCGVVPGVYHSYLECALNTSGVKGNLCNAFPSKVEAERAFSAALAGGMVKSIPRTRVAARQ